MKRTNVGVLHLMEKQGGHFASNLATAWMRADGENSQRLMGAFSDLYDTYEMQYNADLGRHRVHLLEIVVKEAETNLQARKELQAATTAMEAMLDHPVVASSDARLERALECLRRHEVEMRAQGLLPVESR